MRLKQYWVKGFRSVDDSGSIDVDDVTSLIGTNESGKTNLLLPLWKLNPAKDGAISPTADYPRKHYNDFRSNPEKPVFIEAVFRPTPAISSELAKLTGFPSEMFAEVHVSKTFDGKLAVSFPLVHLQRDIPQDEVIALLVEAKSELERATALKSEVDHKPLLIAALERAIGIANSQHSIDGDTLQKAIDAASAGDVPATPKSSIAPRFARLKEELGELAEKIAKPHPDKHEKAVAHVLAKLPSFVYYSNYGNLDSEIYLPHVIENMNREGLGSKEAAKARTLKVLFEFVGLRAEEILELGRDLRTPTDAALTAEQIQAVSEKKKERSILLQSAGAKLTTEFRRWWKQGDYRFRFEADGDHFRIWVSDDKRPEEVELEGRSTGLQWFLSFYLVFLVESKDSHQGAILLLDEPGLSLHPLAQQDLTLFFDGLAETNQIIYTTHSPFLIDSDRLDRARKIYVAEDGTSKASPNLQADSNEKTQRAAGYTVWSALGLTVAESFLYGCKPVIVEGPSDQHYLTAVKNYLVRAGQLRPARDLVFPPAGGAKGVKAVAAMVVGRDETLPLALFDADTIGLATAKQLKETLYAEARDRVLCISEFSQIDQAETEDLFPISLISRSVDIFFRIADQPFSAWVKPGTAVVPQIEQWAAKNRIKLDLGWKVEVAKRVKQHILEGAAIDEGTIKIWVSLFSRFTETPQSEES